ncbi:hypothetical protein [Curtobacterium sp. ISL-83]|uniref:hypothetical protein n=1 Tax=Curtobacterium sp. ISL-83 TaxID=2819145 RepID=UPI001BEB8F54|nr:hypothetical protein [Curtobacterium sp. ISL-83]MBT2502972.1 hypothetical protein [Curtobacterium sp. ISL-83]
MAERYVIQHALTKEVLSYDLKGVSRGPLKLALSAVGTVELTVGPATATAVASDGAPVFQEWGTLVTLDDEGQIRFRGIVTDMDYDGSDWKITVSSMGTYPFGLPYEGAVYYGAKVDPADIVRLLWDHVQSFADSDLDVTVTGKTSVRIGTYSTQNKTDTLNAYNAAVAAYNAANSDLKKLRDVVTNSRKRYSDLVTTRTNASKALTAAKKTKNAAKIAAAQTTYNQSVDNAKAQQTVIDQQSASVDAQAKVVASKKAAKDAAYKLKVAASKAVKDDGGAYELLPWEAPDCGSKIKELADSTPFDWYEKHSWAGDTPQTQIVIAHPRVGRRLSGDGAPLFQQGVNITVALDPSTSGEDFANAAYGVGAGEGVGAIRRSITKRNGKLRRVAAFQSKDIKTAQAMDTKLRAELEARLDTLAVSRIVVSNHLNSPRGSYSLGDDIYVQGQVPHYGPFGLWHRIVGIAENEDGSTELDLKRSDSFTYGQGVAE